MDNADPQMHDASHHQRTPPQRQAPLRRPPLGLPASAGAGMPGFVERGVDTAYTVIDAYMKRGLEAAQRQAAFVPTSAAGATGAASADAPGLLNASLAQAATSLAGPWAQLVRAWADGVAALGPALSRAGTPSPGAPAAAAPGAAAAEPAPAASPRPKVTLQFMASRPAEISLTLEPGADLAVLQARWDAPVAGGSAGTLVFYSEPGQVHLQLTLDDSAAPGHHQATVTDLQGQTWGTVALFVADRG